MTIKPPERDAQGSAKPASELKEPEHWQQVPAVGKVSVKHAGRSSKHKLEWGLEPGVNWCNPGAVSVQTDSSCDSYSQLSHAGSKRTRADFRHFSLTGKRAGFAVQLSSKATNRNWSSLGAGPEPELHTEEPVPSLRREPRRERRN